MRPAGLWAAALLLAALARAQTGDTCWLNGARVVPGERVPAGDQCNVCACVANSLVCTSRACPSASPIAFACPTDLRTCADGSTVARSGAGCEFAACPSPSPVPARACALADGTFARPGWMGRAQGDEWCNGCRCAPTGTLRCSENACPSVEPRPSPSASPVVCAADRFLCPDGTSVGRSGASCTFQCPEGTVADRDTCTLEGSGLAVPVGWVGPDDRAASACNTCTCEAANSLVCTDLDCEPNELQCTNEILECPDGSYVGRTGANCAFGPCPVDPSAPTAPPTPRPRPSTVPPAPGASASTSSSSTLSPASTARALGADEAPMTPESPTTSESPTTAESPDTDAGNNDTSADGGAEPALPTTTPEPTPEPTPDRPAPWRKFRFNFGFPGCQMFDGRFAPVGWSGPGSFTRWCARCTCVQPGMVVCEDVLCPVRPPPAFPPMEEETGGDAGGSGGGATDDVPKTDDSTDDLGSEDPDNGSGAGGSGGGSGPITNDPANDDDAGENDDGENDDGTDDNECFNMVLACADGLWVAPDPATNCNFVCPGGVVFSSNLLASAFTLEELGVTPVTDGDGNGGSNNNAAPSPTAGVVPSPAPGGASDLETGAGDDVVGSTPSTSVPLAVAIGSACAVLVVAVVAFYVIRRVLYAPDDAVPTDHSHAGDSDSEPHSTWNPVMPTTIRRVQRQAGGGAHADAAPSVQEENAAGGADGGDGDTDGDVAIDVPPSVTTAVRQGR